MEAHSPTGPHCCSSIVLSPRGPHFAWPVTRSDYPTTRTAPFHFFIFTPRSHCRNKQQPAPSQPQQDQKALLPISAQHSPCSVGTPINHYDGANLITLTGTFVTAERSATIKLTLSTSKHETTTMLRDKTRSNRLPLNHRFNGAIIIWTRVQTLRALVLPTLPLPSPPACGRGQTLIAL